MPTVRHLFACSAVAIALVAVVRHSVTVTVLILLLLSSLRLCLPRCYWGSILLLFYVGTMFMRSNLADRLAAWLLVIPDTYKRITPVMVAAATTGAKKNNNNCPTDSEGIAMGYVA